MKVEQTYTLNDAQYLRRRIENTGRVVNGLLEFGNPANGNINMSGFWVSVNTGAANTPFTVTHNLGRIPVGMLVFSVDQPNAVIQSVSVSSWTTVTAQFQCNVASVNLVGFVT